MQKLAFLRLPWTGQPTEGWGLLRHPRLRRLGRWVLAAALIVGGALAWQLGTTLQDRTDGLTRYVRVDIWAAQQAEVQVLQFLRSLARHVAGDAVDMAAVQAQLRGTQSAAALLIQGENRNDLNMMADAERVVDQLQTALAQVEHRLADQGRGDARALLEAVEGDLAPSLRALRQLATDLTHLRLALQDKDLSNVRDLIGLNRSMLIGFFIVAGVFSCLLLGEAEAARQSEAQAVTNQQRFRDIAETASDWIWETDRDLCFTYVSEQIERSTGASAERHLGSPLMSLAPPMAQQPGLQQYLEATAEQRSFRDVVCDTGQDGAERRIVRLSGKPFFDDQGLFLGYRGVGSDISAEVHREERIRFLAEHDQLTRLPNRVFFQDRLRELLLSQRDRDQHGVLLALDLDGFKDINDSFGHDVGDALIVAVAERLVETIRTNDMLARLGGDEFAIVQTGLQDDAGEDAELAERLLDAFRAPFHASGKELVIGVSIGIARFPIDGRSVEDLMKAADLALYSAKAGGRGCFEFFDHAMTRRLHQRKRLESELRRAIENGALDLHFQPQVHLPSGGISGAEALVRWSHPELGQVSPGEFVPVAEETGLILPLGQWVLETACAEAAKWAGIDGRVAVNISPAQFTHQDLVAAVETALVRTGLPPQRLELEITEGLLMGDTRAAIETLDRLRDMGVQLAIDDFGTGYSSLSYLKRFRVHKVKIDQSFVGDLEVDEDDRRIVHAILMLGQALNLSTIAEGVETPMQSELLTSLGCDQAQGYLYGKPMPADHLRQLWRHARGSTLAQTAS